MVDERKASRSAIGESVNAHGRSAAMQQAVKSRAWQVDICGLLNEPASRPWLRTWLALGSNPGGLRDREM